MCVAGILMLLLLKFFYIGVGAYGLTDEWRYDLIFSLIESIKQGDYSKFCKTLTDTNGRPGELLIRFPFAVIQIIWYKISGQPVSHSNFIPQFFNYSVVLANTFLVYRISFKGSAIDSIRHLKLIALVSTLAYCALLNHGLYIRHLLPYDNALLCFLVAIYILSEYKLKGYHYLLIGILVGLGFSIYPGYFLFVGILMSAVFIKSFFERQLYNFLKVSLGAFAVLFCWELITRLGGYSYFNSLKTLSGTITQGSFEEGLTYPVTYLLEVEQLTGFLLLISPVAYFIFRNRGEMLSYSYLVGILGLIFLMGYALQCFFFQKMVFYGRILHMFMPIFVLSLCYFLLFLYNRVSNRIFYTLIFLLNIYTITDFLVKNNSLMEVAYPRDVLLSYGIEKWVDVYFDKGYKRDKVFLFEIEQEFYLPAMDTINSRGFTFINFANFYPITGSHRSITLNDKRLIFNVRHFQTIKPYSYEGGTKFERDFLNQIQLNLKIYKNHP